MHPVDMKCGAQATQEIKRKLYPSVTDCGASATNEEAPTGVMSPSRMRGLALTEPLTLEQFVALIMPHLDTCPDPKLNKNHIQHTSISTQSPAFHNIDWLIAFPQNLISTIGISQPFWIANSLQHSAFVSFFKSWKLFTECTLEIMHLMPSVGLITLMHFHDKSEIRIHSMKTEFLLLLKECNQNKEMK